MKSLFPTEKPEIEIGKVILEVADEMGLFNGIKKAVGKAVKAIKNTVVSIFRSKVKEDTTKALKEARDRAEKAEKALEEEKRRNAEKVADSLGHGSYDLNEELYEVQESFRKIASDVEDNMIECIHGTVHDMLEQLESVNESTGLNLNMAYLNSMETSLRNQVTGFIQNRVKRSLSLDNPECKDILKMEGKTAKQMALQRFQDKIFADAVNDLWELVKNIFTEKNSAIFTQIESRFTTIEMNVEESIHQFEEIQKAKQLDKEQLKEKQDNYQNMIDIAVWCIQSIERDTLV